MDHVSEEKTILQFQAGTSVDWKSVNINWGRETVLRTPPVMYRPLLAYPPYYHYCFREKPKSNRQQDQNSQNIHHCVQKNMQSHIIMHKRGLRNSVLPPIVTSCKGMQHISCVQFTLISLMVSVVRLLVHQTDATIQHLYRRYWLMMRIIITACVLCRSHLTVHMMHVIKISSGNWIVTPVILRILPYSYKYSPKLIESALRNMSCTIFANPLPRILLSFLVTRPHRFYHLYDRSRHQSRRASVSKHDVRLVSKSKYGSKVSIKTISKHYM